MSGKQKIQAQQLLVKQGVCASADEAKRWIMAGKVFADDRRVSKGGELIAETAEIRVKGVSRYVGKGGHKLAGVIETFGIPVQGRIALDTGASTGGFTDYLIQHGAERVYAIDVGFGTLAGKLRNDERVVNLEKTNISDLNPGDLVPPPSLATVDLSYLSLRKGIPAVARLLGPGGEMVCLVKPLFEVDDPEARRVGRIEDPRAYVDVLNGLVAFAEEMGFAAKGITHSPIRGNKGVVEFWLWIAQNAHKSGKIAENIEKSVEKVQKLPIWRKT